MNNAVNDWCIDAINWTVCRVDCDNDGYVMISAAAAAAVIVS
jgi:hypothetical protein